MFKKICQAIISFICFIGRIFEINESDEDEEEKQETENMEKEKCNNENSMVKVIQLTLTRLYVISQKITIFQESFPKEYTSFKDRIEELKGEYQNKLNLAQKDLTYEIDPEKDGEQLSKIRILESDVECFIQKEVKFDEINKKLQKLILKLNILYNVSVVHTKSEEQQKAMAQTERATLIEFKIVSEFKSNEYVLEDMRMKDKIVKLISYLDYEIFKLSIRNSEVKPIEQLKKLAILTEFERFDYDSSFKAFLEEELVQLNNLIDEVQDIEYRKILKKDYTKILTDITHSIKNDDEILIKKEFWKNIFELESNIFELLKEGGIEKENIKIEVTSQIDISLNESDVLDTPKSDTYLALLKIFSKTQDDRILLVMKLLKNISNEVTYREIYFLLVLFDVTDVVKANCSNEFFENINKYYCKYHYDTETINNKKHVLAESDNSEYIFGFFLEDFEQELLETLKKLNMDYKNIDNKIFLNKHYFNGLNNVMNSLETKSI